MLLYAVFALVSCPAHAPLLQAHYARGRRMWPASQPVGADNLCHLVRCTAERVSRPVPGEPALGHPDVGMIFGSWA